METNGRVFVGFGFGAIQAGLFLYEAYKTGSFARFVVAEVIPETVAAVRSAGGVYSVNIAHSDGIGVAGIGPIEICNPAVEQDRHTLVHAVADAREIATAVPSVAFYRSESPGSIHRLLAAGLLEKARRGGPTSIVYAAENHNRAAEILTEAVGEELPEDRAADVLSHVQFLNTVIGKMSGVVTDPEEIRLAGLEAVTPESGRAFLVEEFNRILISRVRQNTGGKNFDRGISVFEEKRDLLPFEEAKLYGHNATHALAAYLARQKGVGRISDLRSDEPAMRFLREAFLEESGEGLIRKHRGVDALFTPRGYEAYADDLLERMTNPFLRDTTERVGRDPARKLGWDDRLIGTIRLALGQRIRPWRYSIGAAAALAWMHPEAVSDSGRSVAPWLQQIWGPGDRVEETEVLRLVQEGWESLRR